MQEGKNFRVITPYDPQRGAIEAALKHADLKWEDTVFNVDSFQGMSNSGNGSVACLIDSQATNATTSSYPLCGPGTSSASSLSSGV